MEDSEVFKMERINSRVLVRDGLRERMRSIVSAWESNLAEKRELEAKKGDRQSVMKLYENQVREKVNSSVDGEGKKKYSNQEQRDIAVSLFLSDDIDYKSLSDDLTKVSFRLSELNDILEMLKVKFKAVQSEIDLEKMEL